MIERRYQILFGTGVEWFEDEGSALDFAEIVLDEPDPVTMIEPDGTRLDQGAIMDRILERRSRGAA